MTSENLQRSTYRDPTIPGNPVRTGSPTRAENALDMDQYYRRLERIHDSGLHGWGVAIGLSVTVTLNTPDTTLIVLPGIALDSNGQHISLAVSSATESSYAEIGPNADDPGVNPTLVLVTATGVSFPIPSTASGDKYLTIQFRETFDTDAFQNLGIYRYFHTPWLRLLDVAGFANDGIRLVLAKVSLGTGATAGQVTALAPDVRQGTDLPVGSIHLQKSVTTSPTATTKSVQLAEAGVIRAYSNGIDISVPGPTDEIHLERDDGGNFAKVSLGAEKIVARQGNGTESVVIDTPSGNITTSGPVNVNSTTGIRQNKLHMSGGIEGSGGSSLSYNAHRNEANTDWVFPDPSRPAVTVEMDDYNGIPRFQVYSTTTGNPTGWIQRFAIDGNSGNVVVNGDISTHNINAGTSGINGEVIVNNAQNKPAIVLNGGIATVDVGGSTTDGILQVLRADGTVICSLDGKNGIKILGPANRPDTGALLKVTDSTAWASFGYKGSAGNFVGAVDINGHLTKSSGSFKIDHPLDPANKYLHHSFVESSDMKNIYDGVAVLDANGEAVIELPLWFEALNRDFRYQLTCIGGYAPVYIAEKLHANRFKIAGGTPNLEVSWQVTGIRQDAWANAHPCPVEEDKSSEEQDYYLHPELFGAPKEKQIMHIHDKKHVPTS